MLWKSVLMMPFEWCYLACVEMSVYVQVLMGAAFVGAAFVGTVAGGRSALFCWAGAPLLAP